jgi:hypothetical protein
MWVSGQRYSPVALPRGKEVNTRCTGGEAGARANLDGCRATHSQREFRFPDRPVRRGSLKQPRYLRSRYRPIGSNYCIVINNVFERILKEAVMV